MEAQERLVGEGAVPEGDGDDEDREAAQARVPEEQQEEAGNLADQVQGDRQREHQLAGAVAEDRPEPLGDEDHAGRGQLDPLLLQPQDSDARRPKVGHEEDNLGE